MRSSKVAEARIREAIEAERKACTEIARRMTSMPIKGYAHACAFAEGFLVGQRVLDRARLHHPHLGECVLHQDGDLWVVPVGDS